MIIDTSQLSYQASHRSVSSTTLTDETLALSGRAGRQAAATAASTQQSSASDTVTLSAQAGASPAGENGDLSAKEMLMLLVIESMVGHKIKLYRGAGNSAASGAGASAPASNPSTRASRSSAPASNPSAQAASTAGVINRRTEAHYEMEKTSFQAKGVVETADGRRIEFSAELSMQRQFESRSVSTTTTAQSTDPLVVNFGGAPAQVTGAKIAFDLNSDGAKESVSFVAGGSGFLALDSNGDGKINNGRELFGPNTGNGFGELGSYDSDGNGWIDEKDPIFAKLKIWSLDGLSSLAEKGIGAISTSSAETPFALKDSANVLQADIRSTGIYLMENGTAGTIQQVDLATTSA